MAQETGQPEANTGTHLGDWARSLVARARRARSALSPWVQRALGTGAPGRRLSLSLSEEHGRALVERVTRQGEGGRVWRPNLGRVSPATFDRFGGDIVRRHRPLADKYHLQVPEWDPEQSTRLALAPGGAVGPRPRADARQPGPPAGLPPMPSVPPSPPSGPPRQGTSPSAMGQAQRAAQRPPGGRVFSRVEELTPAASRPWEAGSPQQPGVEPEALAEEGAALDAERVASTEQPPAAPSRRTLESPPAIERRTPPLQRRPAGDQEAKDQRPAAPPREAPPSVVKARPVAEVGPEGPPPVSPMPWEPAVHPEAPSVSSPQVEAAETESAPHREMQPLQLERRPEEKLPWPVSPPEIEAPEIEPTSHPEVPPVRRREDAELPTAQSVPEAEAAGTEPVLRREAPSLGHRAGEEPLLPVSPPPVSPPPTSPPEVEAADMEPAPRREVPPLQRAPLPDHPPPVGHRVGEEAQSAPARLPEVQAADVEPASDQEVPPLEPRSVEEGSPQMPPLEELPPVQRLPASESEILAPKVPGTRPPSAGPRQEVERAEAGEVPVGAPEEGPVPDRALPILGRVPRTRPIEQRPVQRTAILPQAWAEAPSEEEPAALVQAGRPARGRLWYQAPVAGTSGSEEPQPGRGGLPPAGGLGTEAPIQRLPLAVVPLLETAPLGEGLGPEAPIQRFPLAVVPLPETAPPGEGLVQRQNGTGPAVSPAPGEEGEPDLDELARQVYPLIKHMLAVERERRFSR